MTRHNVSTDGDMTISNSNGRTVYRSTRDIYINGKNVGKTYEMPTLKGARGGSIIAGGSVTTSRSSSKSAERARERDAEDRAQRARDRADRADRAQDKLHKKMYGY